MAGKGKKELTIKQGKLVKALTKANSVAEAGRIAGYGTRQNAHEAYKTIRESFPDVLKRLGMTDDRLGQMFIDGAEGAMKPLISEGVVMENIADEDLRFKYRWALAKMKGVDALNVSDTGVQNATGFSFRVVVTDDRRAAAVARHLSAGRPDNVVIDVDATVHTNVGRAGPGKPEQAIP